MYKSTATIGDIYHLVLPPASKLLVGAEFLNRPVSWACSLRPSPPAFPKLDGNELALIDLEDLRRLDQKMRLDRVVRSLQAAGVSGVAVLGPVTEGAIKAAEDSRIALFELPGDVPLMQIERSIIRLIVDRSGYIAQRSADLQRELNQAALNGGGLGQIAQRLAGFAQQPVVVVGDDGRVSATAGLGELAADQRQWVLDSLPNATLLRSWVATQPADRLTQVTGRLPLANSGSMRLFGEAVVSAICAGDSVRGYCLLLRGAGQRDQDVSAVEEVAVLQGASAAALEWAKQNAVGIAEERMRAAFLDELLATEVADEQAWVQRGASLNYNLARPHVAMIIDAQDVPGWPAPLLRFVQQHHVAAPYARREEGILLFWPTDDPKSGRSLKAVAHELVEKIQSLNAKARVIIGIGRPGVGPAHWGQSQIQARESWRLGKEWQTSPVTYFGDLGLYQLLAGLSTNPEAARFYRKTLGKLINHDDSKNAELVQTLEAFFICHGNLSQTAARLHIHRNTLTYRLDQISSITQLDLDDADARFSLQLALKLRPVLK
ncbi:MAG: helix-turn-helix domain-containing protein [Caldilineaceae bacterium]|nr:helix-turn-helix domain-containing protein [Caldilineaceae bacterium]